MASGDVIRMSPALWRKLQSNGGGALYLHWCPACGEGHTYRVKGTIGPQWSFNGDIDKPSFTPSMLRYQFAENGVRSTKCHYFVTDGTIQYCADCPHAFAGRTVPLVPIPEDYGF